MPLFPFKKSRPFKKYERYVDQAFKLEEKAQLEEAIELMLEAVEQPFNKREIASGFFYLGFLFQKEGDIQLASDYFHRTFKVMQDEELKYNKNFRKAIQLFIENGEKERAQYWLNDFLKRERFHRKFYKLADLQKEIDQL